MKLAGTKQEVIAKVFITSDDGKIAFSAMPSAISKNILDPEELFDNWGEFRDYIMEGQVMYQIKFEDQNDAVEMFVKLYGTPRDRYIVPAVMAYIAAAGLSIIT
jgi:hypothetical protein